jgi:RNA polymerase sigma-70 factor (ECF subfamily)
MTNPKEAALIDEIKNGQSDNYRYFVDRYHQGLILHLYNLTKNQQMAEDIAQESFFRAYQKIGLYNETYAFSTWLYKIADNIAFRQLKNSKYDRDIDDLAELIPDDKPSLPEETDKEFTKEAVRQAIDKLPLSYRQVISLYYWDNFNYEEIASIVERPVGTVRSWLFRAIEQLRKELYGQV